MQQGSLFFGKDPLVKELLGTELPIIQSPMAGVQDSALAIAVCQAGGLGSLPCGMLTIDTLLKEVARIKAATDKPYNLNFFCHQMPSYQQETHDKWQQLLQPFFDEFALQCSSQPNGASRMPFNHDIADALEPVSPPVISFHFGLPEKALLQRVKSWGTKVISSATTVKEALWLESHGVDAIIAQGVEAGGHRGMFLTEDITTQIGLAALLPQVVDRVNVPVIAAGGIADSRGVQAALALGASAVQVGTAYMLCHEAKTSPLHRQALKSANAEHTALTNIFSGRPARGIVNRVMKDLGYIHMSAPAFPYASIEMTQLRSVAEKHNIDDFSPLWSGQNNASCKEISAIELTKQLMAF
ncbi:DUF561 domain-containing protein [Photobacterium sanctipauli]|uniref:Nitronate monooxygenase n=1 Tax=Photobacterium sanctipauli TaxID=1342794 RepID=A0A2T3NZJ4_9GAMM|nr:nitronate monooxygenase [Photobacterium sanctipauli]PSW21701.1 DUF561 domain-containing protein [Photobacterium sanctipauli]